MAQRHHCLGLQRKCLMTWLQHTQESLTEKVSRAEDFYSHMLLRQGFRNWLKVCLHHSGETTPSELAAAALSPHHSVTSHTCSPTFAESHCPPSSNIIPFFRDLVSALHSRIVLLHPGRFPTYCSPPPPLHSLSLLIFLHSGPHYPSLPQSRHCSVSTY